MLGSQHHAAELCVAQHVGFVTNASCQGTACWLWN